MKWNSFMFSLILAITLIGVNPSRATAQTASQNASARSTYIEGRNFFDDGKYADAEKKFREALTKYPKADQSDRTSFYLIQTLIKLNRVPDARKEIESFRRNYPQSSWMLDVTEKSVALGMNNSVSVFASPGAPLPVPRPAVPIEQLNQSLSELQARSRDLEAANRNFRGTTVTPVTISSSLQAEVLRQILDRDVERGIENAKEMLKADPSDNAVIANLPVIAQSSSPQALPFLLSIVGNPNASPNARSQGLFYVSRRSADKADDKDLVAKTLMDLLSKKDTEAGLVGDTMARMNVADRRAALEQIGQSSRADKLDLLEKIYRGGNPTAGVRSDVVQTVAKLTDAKATAFIVEVAQTDKDTSVRRAAVQALAGRKDVDVKTLESVLKSLPKDTAPTGYKLNSVNGRILISPPATPAAPVPPAPAPAPAPAPLKQ